MVIRSPKNPWDTVKFTLREGQNVWPGLAIRVPGKQAGQSFLYVVSTICPHAGCQFGLETDFQAVAEKIGKDLETPVLFCQCHMSTYDPANGGQVLHGPAPRPPFRFEFREQGDDLILTGVVT